MTVTQSGISTFSTIAIGDTAPGTSVTFNNSGSNLYLESFGINLDHPSAGQIRFNGNTALGGSAELVASTSQSIVVASGAGVRTAGGNLTLTAARNVMVDSAAGISSVSGKISIDGNASGLSSGSFFGIWLKDATVSTVSGDIAVSGRGGSETGYYNLGVGVTRGQITTGSGNVTITGKAGSGEAHTHNHHGVMFDGPGLLSASSGSVSVAGTGGFSTTGYNHGVYIRGGYRITGAEDTDVSLTGNGGSGTAYPSMGVLLNGVNSLVTVANGNLSISGTGNDTDVGNFGVGVGIWDYAKVSSTGVGANVGRISITGVGGAVSGASGGSENYGVLIGGDIDVITSRDADIDITGTAGSGGISNSSFGVSLGYPGNAAEGMSSTGLADLTLVADSLRIVNASFSASFAEGTVIVRPKTSGTSIEIGANDAEGALGLTDAELDRITAKALHVGSSESGSITVSEALTHPNSLSLLTGSGLVVNQPIIMAANKDFSASVGTGNIVLDDTIGTAFIANGGRVTLESAAGSVVAVMSADEPLVSSNGFTATGLSLDLQLDFAPAIGQSVTLVDNTSSSPIEGTFANLVQGSFVSMDFGGTTYLLKVNYQGGTGNDLTLTNPFLIGNRVWEDRNGDGVQSPGEPGINEVSVRLLDSTGTIVLDSTTTSGDGNYILRTDIAGSHLVEVLAPAAFDFTSGNAGTDDRVDSDANGGTGRASVSVTLGSPTTTSVDIGLVFNTTLATISDRVFRDDDGDGVQDVGEPGLTGITVRLLDSSYNILQTKTTDDDGHYDFQGLVAGAYYVEAALPSGFEFSAKDQGETDLDDSDVNPATGRTDLLVMAAQEKRSNVDIGMKLRADLGSIGDVIWFDRDGDGVQEPGESGLDDVVVTLWDAAGVTQLQSTTTRDGGRYAFLGLPAGIYQVEVTKPLGLEFTAQNQGISEIDDSDVNGLTGRVTVELGTNENAFSIDAGLKAIPGTATVGGRVWMDINQNGSLDRWEPAPSGAVVTLLDATGFTTLQTTRTASDGSYRFANLPPESYTLRFAPTGAFQFATANQGSDFFDSDVDVVTGEVSVTLTANEGNFDVFAGLVRPATAASVIGQVWHDQNTNGIRNDSEGQATAEMRLLDSSGTRLLSSTRTSATGHWFFDGLNAGSYVIEVVPDRGFGLAVSNAGGDDSIDSDFDPTTRRVVVTVTEGQVVSAIDAATVYDNSSGLISSLVWYDVNGDGLQGLSEPGLRDAELRLFDETGRQLLAETASDADGGYQFVGLRAGIYQIEVTAPVGFQVTTPNVGLNDEVDSDVNPATRRLTVSLASGQALFSSDIGLAARQGAALSGFVFDDNNDGVRNGEAGLSGVTVSLRDSSGRFVLATTRSTSDGFYQFNGLEAGSYIVEFTPPAGFLPSPMDQGSDDFSDSDINAAGRVAVSVGAAQDLKGVDAGLFFDENTATIGGTSVWADLNNDGIRDTGEYNVGDISVRLLDASGVNLLATTNTTASGRYEFIGLAAGTYTVEFVKPADFTFTLQDRGLDDKRDSDVDRSTGRVRVTIAQGQVNRSVDAGLQPRRAGLISGRLFYDRNFDGIQNNGETAIGETQTVSLYDQSGASLIRTVTTNLGIYEFTGLEDGTYQVRFDRPTGMVSSPANVGANDLRDSDAHVGTGFVTVTVAASEMVRGVDAGFYTDPNTGRIDGNVFRDTNKDGVWAADEYSMNFVVVDLLDASGQRLLASYQTREDFSYSFRGLAAGDYVLRFHLQPGWKFSPQQTASETYPDWDSEVDSITGMASVTVGVGEQIRHVHAGMYPLHNSYITGWVFEDANFNGIWGRGEKAMAAGAPILLYSNDGKRLLRETRTYVNGDSTYFSFDGLIPGDYWVATTGVPGYELTHPNAFAMEYYDNDLLTDYSLGFGGYAAANVTSNNGTIVTIGFHPLDSIMVSGAAYNDWNESGQWDWWETQRFHEGDSGIPIALYDGITGRYIFHTVVSPFTGYYGIRGLADGYSYYLAMMSEWEFSPANVGNDYDDSDADQLSEQGGYLLFTANQSDPFQRYFTSFGTYHASGSIGDLVWEDRNGNGRQDVGEPGIAGVMLSLYDTAGELVETTVSDRFGFYSFYFRDNQGTGDYRIELNLPQGYTVTAIDAGDDTLDNDFTENLRTAEATVSFVGGTAITHLDAGLVRVADGALGSISSFVWHDLDNDGVQDPGEPGIDGVEVQLLDPDFRQPIAATKTSHGGHYSFRALQAKDYLVVVRPPSEFDFTGQNRGSDDGLDSDFDGITGEVIVSLNAAEHETSIDAGLVTRTVGDISLVGGSVWHDLNGNGVRDAGESGLADVAVRLYLRNSGEVFAETRTDSSGAYAFRGLGSANYFVEVELPGGFEFTSKDSGVDDSKDSDFDPDSGFTDVFTLHAGTEVTSLDAGLKVSTLNTTILRGRVFRDADGNGIQNQGENGIAGVEIVLLDGTGSVLLTSTMTDSEGNYAFPGLSAGQFLVDIKAPLGFIISPQDNGDDEVDSDVSVTHGRTAIITLVNNEDDPLIDMGLIPSAPASIRVTGRFNYVIPGEDPDGAGAYLGKLFDVYDTPDDAFRGLDQFTDATKVHVAGESFGNVVHNRSGKVTHLDARDTGIVFNSLSIESGNLTLLAGSLTLSTGGQINDGGTLSGSGTIDGAVTVNAGGTLAPAMSPGALTIGSLSLNSGSKLHVEVTSTASFAQLFVNGTVSLSDATFDVAAVGTPAINVGDEFIVIDNDGSIDAVLGRFIGLDDGAVVTSNFLGSGLAARISYFGGDGNDVVVFVVANAAPSGVVLTPLSASLAEDTITSSAIELSTIAIEDDGVGTNTLFLSGPDADSFEIVGNKLLLRAGVTLDFETKTSYSVRVNVDDASVGSTPDAFADFTLTITNVNDAALDELVVQNGQQQRSFVRYLDMVFSDGGADLLDLISNNRITLRRFDPSGNGSSVSVPLPAASVSGRTLKFDFGAQGIGGNRNSNLADGLYQLAIDNDGDGSADAITSFHRLLGDVNGDRVVDGEDKKKTMSFFGQPYSAEADVNGDGMVNSADLSLLTRAFGRRINSPL